MELPIDGEIAQAIDELIGPVAPQVDHLMGLLQQGAYLSDGPGSAICVGFALFVYKYGQHRTESDEIDVCLKAAFADAISNEMVQRHLVGATTFTLNEAAGVPQ